jgi:hypothetical protein
MRLASLSCAAAFAIGACGPEAEPFPPSGATALTRCTLTTEGGLAGCAVLETSAPASKDWFLERVRAQHFEPQLDDGTPVEISVVVHFTVWRAGEEPAR